MSAIINALEKALSADPNDWENRLALIEAYLAEGKKNEAHTQLSEIEALPEDEPSLILAAKAYAACESPYAREIIQPILDANPANAPAHLAMASIAHGEGDSPSAMRHYITATSLDGRLSDPELDAAYGSLAAPKAKPVAPTAAPVAEPEPEPQPEPEPVAAAPAQTMPSTQPRMEFAPRSAAPKPSETDLEAEAAALEAPDEEWAEPEPEPEPELEPAAAELEPEPEPEPKTEFEPQPKPKKPAPRAPIIRLQKRPEPTGVFYPEPGNFPTRTLREALEQKKPAATVDAVTVAKPHLEFKKAAPAEILYTREESLAPEREKVWVAIDREMPVIYDYQHPDPSIFETKVTPDKIKVAASHTDDGQIVATHDLNLSAARKESDLIVAKRIRRDRLNSVVITVLAHVGVLILAAFAVTAVDRLRPPEVYATPSHRTPDQTIEKKEIQKQVTRQPSSVAKSMPEIISALSESNVAISNANFSAAQTSAAFGTTFSPSMDFSMSASSGKSTMLFGEKVDGKVLGVILDVSGSMAEYLPQVIREVDRNFKDAPIVYVNHSLIQASGQPSKITPIVGEDVVPSRDGRTTPYWFLWGDLPRKAPQIAVDRLINTFRTRQNMFLAVGGHNRMESAMDFLITQKIDALYVFSDFEDFVDEDRAQEIGQKLGRSKVKTYVQPAEKETEFLNIMDTKVARRSNGRQMPSLVSLTKPPEEPKPIMVAEKETLPVVENVMHGAPRTAREGTQFYEYQPRSYAGRFDEFKVVEGDTYDLVLCAPEARAYIFLKNEEGAYIQAPIAFGYGSTKVYWNEKYQEIRTRGRAFLRHEEPPGFDGNEFTWKMILEDEIRFEVIFWFKDGTFTGTYAAELPPDGTGDSAGIHFSVPRLAYESKDKYFSYDFPGGLTLDDLRLAMHGNTVTFKLPAQAEESLGTTWHQLGFKRGDNELPYYEMKRQFPNGVRELVVQGRSFGPRVLTARTTSNRLLLTTNTYRADIEAWEGFSASLHRPRDVRHRVTKTEAIEFTVE